MLKAHEKKQVAQSLSVLFRSFRDSRAIDPEAAVLFVEDVSEFSLRAVEETIVRFRRGQIADRDNAFAPSIAEFVAAVRDHQDAMDAAAFWEKMDFITADTPMWRALEQQRGRTMPRIDRKGVEGWYVPKDEVAEVPAAIVEEHRALLEDRQVRINLPQFQSVS